MNRLDLAILCKLKNRGAINAVKALTIDEVNTGDNTCNRIYLNKKLNRLCAQGYVEKGIKSQQALTFFVTPKGLEVIQGV